MRSEGIGALAFVGGRANGRRAAVSLADTAGGTCSSRRALTPGASGTSPSGTCWPSTCARDSSTPSSAAPPTPAMWSSVVCSRPSWTPTSRWCSSIRFGHPLAVDAQRPAARPGLRAGHPRHQSRGPGPTVRRGGTRGRDPLYRGRLGDGAFLDGQDTSAYMAPACVLQPPATRGPPPRRAVRPAGLGGRRRHRGGALAAMNASNGSLVGQHRHRRPRLRRPGFRTAPVLQDRRQQASKPGRPGRGVRRARPLLEGSVRRRGPARAGGDVRAGGARRAAVRQFP